MATASMSNKGLSSEGLGISIGLFAISATWALRYRWRKQQQNASRGFIGWNLPATRSKSAQAAGGSSGSVSSRGQAALSPSIPYLGQFLQALQDQCHPELNRQGFIALCVAENKLVLDLVGERLMQSATAAFSDSAVFCYNSFLGMPLARQAVAYFLARRFLFPHVDIMTSASSASTLTTDGEASDETAGIGNLNKNGKRTMTPQAMMQELNFNHVAIGSGAACLLHQTFWLLGEHGDACLVPAPYYAAFENDMNLIAKVVPVGIVQENPVRGPTATELEQAWETAKVKGCNPRFILLTNPNNPLGTIYKPETVKRIIEWGRQRNMHIIVDEIYALSPLKEKHNFQSVLRILDNKLGTDVHMIWAVSKDFGSSGLRVGILYSQNEIFLEALATSNMFSGVSGPTQYMVAELLTDEPFVDHFLYHSRLRTQSSYEICTSKLEEMVVPFVPAEAGLFVYVDFSSLLPEKTFEWEAKLGQLMFDYAHVVLTPGQSQRDHRPGMFRICYTWVHPTVLEIAMERLSRLVSRLRRTDWNDLGDRALSHVLE